MLPRAKDLLGARREPGREPGREPIMDAAVVLGELVMDASVAPSEAAQPHRHWPQLLACRVLRG